MGAGDLTARLNAGPHWCHGAWGLRYRNIKKKYLRHAFTTQNAKQIEGSIMATTADTIKRSPLF
jgi:hypothetical protein